MSFRKFNALRSYPHAQAFLLCPVFNHFQEWSNHKLGSGKDWEQGYWDHFFFLLQGLDQYTSAWRYRSRSNAYHRHYISSILACMCHSQLYHDTRYRLRVEPKWRWLIDSVSESNCVSLTVWFFIKGGIVAGVQVCYKADRASTILSLCVTWVECWRDTCLLFFLCLYRGNYQYSDTSNNWTLVHRD